jgi:hypothetical protein
MVKQSGELRSVFFVTFIKRNIVPILCLAAFSSPIIGMMLIDVYYYSSVIGWVVGFIFIVAAYIFVTKRPDDSEPNDFLKENKRRII